MRVQVPPPAPMFPNLCLRPEIDNEEAIVHAQLHDTKDAVAEA